MAQHRKDGLVKKTVIVEEESWIRTYWRPMMAWQYFAVCLCDFIIFPLVAMWFAKETGQPWKWEPMTLKESGFYHIAMGLIIGVAAYTRGQENLLRTRIFGQTLADEVSSCRKHEDEPYIDEGLDPPAHPTTRQGG
jgi:hypothetical protein